MSVRVTDAQASVDKVLRLLTGMPDEIPGAINRAMKRAGDTGKAQAPKLATAEYRIPQGTFKTNSKESVKTQGEASIVIRFAGSVIPLIRFNVRYTKGGVFAQAMRETSGAILRNSFVARLGSGMNVYSRLTRKRFPIKKLYGPSTAHMMQNEEVSEEMGEVILSEFDKRADHEVRRILSGYGR